MVKIEKKKEGNEEVKDIEESQKENAEDANDKEDNNKEEDDPKEQDNSQKQKWYYKKIDISQGEKGYKKWMRQLKVIKRKVERLLSRKWIINCSGP